MKPYSPGLTAIFLLAAAAFVSGAYAAELVIVEPSGEQPLYSGQTVRLMGRWEDGEAPEGLRYEWASRSDGPLGEGLRTTVAGLGYRTHEIVLTGLLADSVVATARTTVNILQQPEQFSLSERIDWQGEFSPTGSRMAYTSFRSGDAEIWVATMATRGASRITYQGGMNPVWTTDGSHLVFWSDRAGSRDIWLVDITEDKKTAVELASSSDAEWQPAASPVDSRVAYIRLGGHERRLMVVEPAGEPGESVHETVAGPELCPMFPRWFPDGGSLLFTSYSDSLPVVCSVDLATGAVSRLSAPGAEDADISPDGRLLVMVRDGELWLRRLEDGFTRPLTGDSGGALSPRFSPDGDRIVYAATRSGNYDLWLLGVPRLD